MFAYCSNNPVIYNDPMGHNSEALYWWMSFAPCLSFVDGPLPVGDIIFATGFVVIGIIATVDAKGSSIPKIKLDGIEKEKKILLQNNLSEKEKHIII